MKPGEEVDYLQAEFTRLAHEIEKAQHTADGAMSAANGAKSDIAAHEKICALRYETITLQLGVVPKIFEKLDDVRKMLYIGIGAWIATLGIASIIGVVAAIIKMGGH